MTVIARDQVASDHLVYAWPFPIGPECEVSCSDDEQVVMCPAWMVGDRLGPGRHRWRTPDPTRPVGAFFVLTAPVEIGFDMVTSFIIPTTGQPVRLRASGSLQVRCADPGLLIAQFVGLPFDQVNAGVIRSVSRSVERMLARLLTRRVVMATTPIAVTDPGMLPGIIEELIAYNPTAGAVFGVELIRMGHLVVASDDGSMPFLPLPARNIDWSGQIQRPPEPANGAGNGDPTSGNGHGQHPIVHQAQGEAPTSPRQYPRAATPAMDTIKGMPAMTAEGAQATQPPPAEPTPAEQRAVSGEIQQRKAPPAPALAATSGEIVQKKPAPSGPPASASGEINTRAKNATVPGMPIAPPAPPAIPATPRRAHPVEVQSAEEITHPGIDAKVLTPVPGSLRAPTPTPNPAEPEARGSIMGIGMGAIGHSAVAGEIPTKVPPGGRVLVPGPNGLMQSATVRQLLQGYYELEVGSSGQTIWVPINGVVPEQ